MTRQILEDPSLTVVLGRQRAGKTHRTAQEIQAYLKDNPQTGKKGRHVLVIDNNNEYKWIKKANPTSKNIIKFMQGPVAVRRIVLLGKSGMPLSLTEKMDIVGIAIKHFKNGLLVLDDIDKYAKHTSEQDMVSMLMGVTHIGCDVMTIHQSWRKMTVTEVENKRTIRLHATEDNAQSLSTEKKESMNMSISQIAQIIVKEHFDMANRDYREKKITHDQYLARKSYFLYIDYIMERIYPVHNEETKTWALKKYLMRNKNLVNEELGDMVFEGIITEREKKNPNNIDTAIQRQILKYEHYFN